MAKGKYPSISLITPEFEAFGPNIAVARKADFPGSKAKFSISMPWTQQEAAEVLAAVASVAKQAWPSINANGQIALPNGDLKSIYKPYVTGDSINANRRTAGKSDYQSLAGKIVFRASTVDDSRRPAIWDLNGNPVDPSLITSGTVCRADINIVALTNNPTNPGVTAYVNQILFIRGGSRSGGNVDAFRAFLSSSAPVNPFAAVSNEDEIPY